MNRWLRPNGHVRERELRIWWLRPSGQVRCASSLEATSYELRIMSLVATRRQTCERIKVTKSSFVIYNSSLVIRH